MKFSPFKDNVFVAIETSERKTASGLFLADTVEGSEFGKDLLCGTVIAAGPGGWGSNVRFEEKATGKEKRQFFPVEVCEGEKVLFHKLRGEPCVIGVDITHEYAEDITPGTELRILRNSELQAVLG